MVMQLVKDLEDVSAVSAQLEKMYALRILQQSHN